MPISTIAFKSNRCDRDLCYEMTYFPCCLKVSKYIAIPFYTSLSFRNWWDLSKEVLYDLVGWKVTELPAFKVCPVTTNARFTMYVESFPGKLSTLNAGNFEVFQATRSYSTFLERSHQFLKVKEVYRGILIIWSMLQPW